jgi:hypothetical protein
VGFQSTASIVQSDGIPDMGGPPNATLSYELHTYEATGGLVYGSLEVFGGAGLGSQEVNIRTTTQAESHNDVALRVHAGMSFVLAESGPLRLRGFAIYGTQAANLFTDALELNAINSSIEGGIQVSAQLPSDSYYLEPLFRIGVAAQSGSTEPELYQNAMGNSDFDGLAATASIGFNFGFLDLLDD